MLVIVILVLAYVANLLWVTFFGGLSLF